MPETAAVAIGAASPRRRVALVGFGADSLVEAVAGVVVLWRFAAARATSDDAARRAQRLIGASCFAIALYVAVEAGRSLIGGHEPDASWVGVALAVVTLLTMPARPRSPAPATATATAAPTAAAEPAGVGVGAARRGRG